MSGPRAPGDGRKQRARDRAAGAAAAAPLAEDGTDPVLATVAGYEALALVYDRLWGDVMTEAVLTAIDRLVPPPPDPTASRSVLDLCCGSGQLAGALDARGWDVTALDASPALLARAAERAPGARLLQADARHVRLEAPVDVVVCVFDSMHHMLRAEDLDALLRAARAALRPGGHLLCDLNLAPGFQERFDSAFGLADEDLACWVEGRWDPERREGVYAVTVFLPSPTSASTEPRWRRVDATLRQRAWTLEHVDAALERAGLELAVVQDATPFPGLSGHEGRVFLVARTMQGADRADPTTG